MNWIEAKALHELYIIGQVKKNKTLSNSAEVRFLLNSVNKLQDSHKYIYALESYKLFYESHYLQQFLKYDIFLKKFGLAKPQLRFEVEDIEILIAMYEGRQDGSLEYLREQIVSANETVRGVSLMFFRHEKYLLNKPALTEAVKNVLDVNSFSNEKDQQYIYRLECHNPRMIVLCENLDFLKKPSKPRQHGIELWYAGGKNVRKLEYSNPRDLPIYYSCDWDYDGLRIYSWVKEIVPEIKLLFPNGKHRSIEDTEHASLWNISSDNKLSNELPVEIFSEEQRKLINTLISENTWIIEESNDILMMLRKEDFEFS